MWLKSVYGPECPEYSGTSPKTVDKMVENRVKVLDCEMIMVSLQLMNGGISVQKCTHVIQDESSIYWMYFNKWGNKMWQL